MSQVAKLLKQLENLIEERDVDSKTKITSLIKGMSQEEEEAVGFWIILDIIYWIETLDWEEIDKKTVRKRGKYDISSYTEKKNPARGYLGAFEYIFYPKRQW
jgi:hypothetical protein